MSVLESSLIGEFIRSNFELAHVLPSCLGHRGFPQPAERPGPGRVDAGNTAAADELGTIFYNPAGLIQLSKARDNEAPPEKGFIGAAGAYVIVPNGAIRNAGSTAASPGTLGNAVALSGSDAKNPIGAAPVMNGYATARLADGRGAVGLGINMPF